MNKPMNEPRLGVLVLDRATGRPTAQVPILAIAEVTITPTVGQVVQQIPLGLLVSDGAGYVSFDLKDLGPTTAAEHIWLYPYGREENRVDALVTPEIGAGKRFVVIRIDPIADPNASRLKVAVRAKPKLV